MATGPVPNETDGQSPRANRRPHRRDRGCVGLPSLPSSHSPATLTAGPCPPMHHPWPWLHAGLQCDLCPLDADLIGPARRRSGLPCRCVLCCCSGPVVDLHLVPPATVAGPLMRPCVHDNGPPSLVALIQAGFPPSQHFFLSSFFSKLSNSVSSFSLFPPCVSLFLVSWSRSLHSLLNIPRL